MATEIKQVAAARQESERKRKQAENQLQDYVVRLAELERGKGDLGEKSTKLQVTQQCFIEPIVYRTLSDSSRKWDILTSGNKEAH